jgi:hypothetical protein
VHGRDCWKYLSKGREVHRLVISFSVIPPARKNNPQRYTKMCVTSNHNPAGMVSLMWCQIVKLSPAPDDTFAQSELKELFQIDRLARSYGIQKLLRCRELI